MKPFALLSSAAFGVGLLLCTMACADDSGGTAHEGRPNIVFILVDDMRWDAMSFVGHPFVETPNMDRLAAEGVHFRNAFVTTSLCSPSRASILTGLYAHRHGVRGNRSRGLSPSDPYLPGLLQQAGYETAFIGKCHIASSADPRPGFDHWLSFEGQGDYEDPVFNIDGREEAQLGYVTDLLTSRAIAWLGRKRERPFFLMLSHKAVHAPFTPAPRHRARYPDTRIPEPPNWQDDFADKPYWQRAHAAHAWKWGSKIDRDRVPEKIPATAWDGRRLKRLNYYRTLLAVDESLGEILAFLEAQGLEDDTLIVLASDNGYSLGEHHRGDKRTMYEESIRIPLVILDPRSNRPDTSIDEMVLGIDIAPTLLESAGVPVPDAMQGRSMLPLLEGNSSDWRQSFLYEYFEEPRFRVPTILGVRTPRWSYATTPEIDDIDEVYDLKNDAAQLHNRIDDPLYRDTVVRMQLELERLLVESGYREPSEPEAIREHVQSTAPLP